MDYKLKEVLSGDFENHIYPFFWVHGESEEELRKYVRVVYDAHIYALCVESRPHKDFVGPKWWEDMAVILDEAKKLGMKVWLLDDSHFPTGFANGRLKNEKKELRKLFLDQWHIQTSGYRKNSRFRFSDFVRDYETLVEIIAVKLMPDGGYAEPIVLTDKAKNGVLYWDVPDGEWRIYYIKETAYADEDYYVNTLDPDSVAMLIDEVYESHYNHFKEYFGDTFVGFFSDEPLLGNPHRSKNCEVKVGQPFTKVPWRKDLLKEIKAAEPKLKPEDLVFLWAEGSSCGEIDYAEKTAQLRYTFMNVITALYGTNFCKQLGDWCRDHGVKYIGHIIEDNNAHSRCGHTAGHYFRSMVGQDMSGMDYVFHQLMPGTNSGFFMGPHNWWENFEWDEEFFHFALSKMAASFSHIDPLKKGRAMCEIFGAFGWGEGLNHMTWMANHTLTNGINNYVPHAFSLKDFPDEDCPPHFYGQGRNPQYRYFKHLMDYMNRMSHILSDGKHVAQAAVLYHGEADWTSDAMYIQKPIRRILEAQLDCDVLPTDAFVDCGDFANKMNIFKGCKATVLDDKKLYMNGESYGALIIPEAEALPGNLLEWIIDADKKGLPVFFVNARPVYASTIGSTINAKTDLDGVGKVISLDELVPELERLGVRDVSVKTEEKVLKFLRYYHYVREDADFYVFFNSSPSYTLHASACVGKKGYLNVYDAFENKQYSVKELQADDEFELVLAPGEAAVYFVSDSPAEEAFVNKNTEPTSTYTITPINGWRVETATALEYPSFKERGVMDKLCDFLEIQDDFSGTVRYTAEFDGSQCSKDMAYLDLGEVYEAAEVWINGQKLGTRIAAPYVFEVKGACKEGKNQIVVEVTGTLEPEMKDGYSGFITLNPYGLLGDVRLISLK